MLHLDNSTLPPTGFIIAVPLLTLVVGAIAALIPAAIASRRDPVSILRVP